VSVVQVTSLNVRSNIVAAYTAAGRSAEVEAVTGAMKISANDGFEVAFNLACSTLHCGDFARAQETLLLATRLGEPSSSLSIITAAPLALALLALPTPSIKSDSVQASRRRIFTFLKHMVPMLNFAAVGRVRSSGGESSRGCF